MKKIYLLIAIIILVLFGVYSYKSFFNKHEETAKKEEKKQIYTCPMHPQIISDKPGSCPICGMDLVPVQSIGKKESKDEIEGLSKVFVSDQQAKMLGLTYEKSEKREIKKEIITSATIVQDETRLYKINTKISGWVEKLFVNQTGQYVRKGQPLMEVYSPEILSAKEEYISILKSLEKLKDGDSLKNILISLKDSAKERLRLLDVSEEEIEKLEREKRASKTVTVFSPYSGFVLEKMIVEGQRLMMSDVIFTISDLSRVWADVDIYQPDLPYIKVGMPVSITLPYMKNRVFNGKVSFIYPQLNPETRTLKVRLEVENQGYILKPQMYAEARLKYSVGKKVSISESAVYRTGEREYVFVKDKENHLVPTIVKTGILSSDGYYEIISGLSGGEEVLSSASFLIDSESNLKAVFKKAHEH